MKNERDPDRRERRETVIHTMEDSPLGNHSRQGVETQFATGFQTLLHNALQDPDRGVEWMRLALGVAPPSLASCELYRTMAAAESADSWEGDLADLCRAVFALDGGAP